MHDPRPRSANAHAGASSVPVAPWIDSHAHLGDPAFADDLDATLERVRLAGGEGVVCIGESLASAERAKRIAEDNPGFVWWTIGVHPHDAAGFDPVRDAEAIALGLQQGAVAVGECGLDYHYDHSPRALQRRAFASQLALAAQHDKPVVVHTREAEDDTIAMVREAGQAGIRGVLHCFGGSAALAEAGLAAGWYLSYAGVVTFKKWAGDDIVRSAPAERILVESDSPYLAPVPNRGKRNEPAWCAYTLARLAALREADASELGKQVTANARRLFRLS